MGRLGRQIKDLRDSALSAAKDRELRSRAIEIGREVANAAVEGANVKKRNGQVSKVRVMRALATPAVSGRRIAKAVGSEALRRARAPRATTEQFEGSDED